MNVCILMSFIFLDIEANLRVGAFKDRKAAIVLINDAFSMYFILSVSKRNIYRVMASQKACTAKVFIYFLNELLNLRNRVEIENDSIKCFVMDNASIHKTAQVEQFAKKKSIRLLTISPYSPALNGAETVIQSIKSKVKKRRSQGR